MDRGNVLSGAAFTAVLRSSFVFVCVLGAMAVFSIELIERSMTRELRTRVVEMEQNLRRAALANPEANWSHWVAAASQTAAGETLAYAVFDAEGTRLSGNTELKPEVGEWLQAETVLETATPQATPLLYLLHATRIDTDILVTGRSMEIVRKARNAAIRGFALTGGIVVVAMLTIGYELSRRSQDKLERIEATLDRVASGDTKARIGGGLEDDQIDRISRRIDARLDDLERVMQGTRRTVASVAHDLRRPLARATLGLEQALTKAESGQDPRGEIEDAQADLAGLTRVIATILRIARIEGEGAAALQPVDLGPILAEIAEIYAPVAEDAGQTLILDLGPAPGPDLGPLLLRGDGEMVAQMVVNLVQNAVTHAGDHATITLTASPDREGVRLTVSDTGPGISADLRARVFEPFFRADEARTVEGSGLGLPLVKAIAERHAAQVFLEDARPGLRVVVTFPPV